MLTYIIIAIPTLFILKALLSSDPSPIFGIYSQKGKWYTLKYWAFYILFTLRKRQNAKAKNVEGGQAGYGMRSKNSIEEMDKVQKLPEDKPLVGNIKLDTQTMIQCYSVSVALLALKD